MRIEVLEYLKEYIKNKYPMYYDVNNQVDFMQFINLIASDKKFESELKAKSTDRSINDVLKNGDIDYVIDDLVDVYAKDRYFKIWDNLEDLSNRIKAAILKESKKNSKIEVVSEDVLNRISNEIALGIIKNEDIVDYSPYKNGTYDEKYVEDYNYYLVEYKKIVLNHVENVINRKLEHSKFRVSDDTYALMLSNISSIIMRDFEFDKILNGSCDRQIIRALNFFRKKLIEEISAHVHEYIVKEIDNLMGVSITDVTDDILKVTVVTGEISADKLLKGKLNSIINGFVSRRREKAPGVKEAVNRIKCLIIKYFDSSLSDDEIDEITIRIYEKLQTQSIFDKDIVSSDYEGYIKKLIDEEMRVFMSVEQKGKPKSIKPNWLKKLFPKHIISLALAATMVIGTGKAVVNGIQTVITSASQFFNDIKNSKSKKTVDEFDGYKYSLIFTRYTDAFNPMINNVTDFYNKSLGYSDPEYAYLGFYRMYGNVMEDKLAIMDMVLYDLQWNSKNNPELSGFYEKISKYDCYLDFVLDRLEAMGCKEINDDKYREAIGVYKNAMRAVDDENETAMDILIVSFSKHADAIEEIMSLYREYSAECEVRFGNELITINDNNKGRII